MEAAMAKMRAVQVARAGGPLELVEREMPEPARAHHPVPARGWVPGRVRFGAWAGIAIDGASGGFGVENRPPTGAPSVRFGRLAGQGMRQPAFAANSSKKST